MKYRLKTFIDEEGEERHLIQGKWLGLFWRNVHIKTTHKTLQHTNDEAPAGHDVFGHGSDRHYYRGEEVMWAEHGDYGFRSVSSHPRREQLKIRFEEAIWSRAFGIKNEIRTKQKQQKHKVKYSKFP